MLRTDFTKQVRTLKKKKNGLAFFLFLSHLCKSVRSCTFSQMGVLLFLTNEPSEDLQKSLVWVLTPSLLFLSVIHRCLFSCAFCMETYMFYLSSLVMNCKFKAIR